MEPVALPLTFRGAALGAKEEDNKSGVDTKQDEPFISSFAYLPQM